MNTKITVLPLFATQKGEMAKTANVLVFVHTPRQKLCVSGAREEFMDHELLGLLFCNRRSDS